MSFKTFLIDTNVFEKVKGLPAAFETPGVCSNYSPLYVNKTLQALKNFKTGK